MNETSPDSIRHDSADDGSTAHNDRHAIQTYLSDALALERHITRPLARQTEMEDSAHFAEALSLMVAIKATTDAHIRRLERQLEAAGGHAGSPIKSAWSELLGAGAAAIDSARKTKVSKNLRDDYTALSLANISYTMLHATALGLGDTACADLAQQHLADYAALVVNIGKAMPAVVLEELRADGEHVAIDAADIARQDTDAAWK
jgi:ferritin-like metal-binding protein YciE